jgi:hypothetical protein
MPNHNKEEIAVDEDQLLEANDAIKYLAERGEWSRILWMRSICPLALPFQACFIV